MSLRLACWHCLATASPAFPSSSSSSYRAITSIDTSSRKFRSALLERSLHSSSSSLARNKPHAGRSHVVEESEPDDLDNAELHQEIDDIEFEEDDLEEQEPFSLVDDDEEIDIRPRHGRRRRRVITEEEDEAGLAEPDEDTPFGLKVLPKEKVFDLTEEGQETFDDFARELLRRKKVTEAKRRQRGGGFIDHIRVLVRGGKGGSGCAAFDMELGGRPSGGRGGAGGAVYVRTSPHLTSLNTVKSRYFGHSGANGSGSVMHGKAGEDVYIEVPVGTVLREVRRRGELEAALKEEEEDGIDSAERQRRRWARWFIRHPSLGPPGEEDDDEMVREFKKAERLLRDMKRWQPTTPGFEADPPIVLDIAEPLEEPVLLSPGGIGGLGNIFFASHRPGQYKTSRIASAGIMPYTSLFEVELKLFADVGFVGFPNAGKSTLLRGLTGRRAEVANYEFTTLNPQVGVVIVNEDGSWDGQREEGEAVEETWKERQAYADGLVPKQKGSHGGQDKYEALRFTISDNPGILPLASQNIGLGHSFLRSIERSLAIAYVVDLSRQRPDRDLKVLRDELEAYKPGLSHRGGLVVLTKADQVDEETGKEKVAAVRTMLADMDPDGQVGLELVVLSGKYGLGMKGLVETLSRKVLAARVVEESRKAERKKVAEQEKVAQRLKHNDALARQGLDLE